MKFFESLFGKKKPPSQPPPPSGDFDPGSYAVEVRYRNFRGEEKTFVGDRRTVRMRGAHLSIRLAPTGQRVSFARSRLQNAAELLALVPPKGSGPTKRERQVLSYHAKHGSTSPLHEGIRRSWPQWMP